MPAKIRFPVARAWGFALGFVLSTLGLQLVPYDPTAVLDRQANGRGLTLPAEFAAAAEPAEQRIVVLGASETVAYPYAPVGAASYATLLAKGLAAVLPQQRWRSVPIGETAVDSAGLVRCAETALAGELHVLCVTLGGNELNRRLFSRKQLVPATLPGWIHDRLSRARLLFEELQRAQEPRAQAGGEAEVLLRSVPDARPAEPPFAELPLPAADVALLHERTRNAMRQITAMARPRGVRVLFLLAPYDLAGSWPAGMSERNTGIDTLVRQAQRDLPSVDRARVEAIVRDHPLRADAWFLHGLVLRRDGEAAAARTAFERARDLDPSPQHPTSALVEVIRATAQELGAPFLALDDALLAPDGIPDPARFLDSKHPDLEGHRRIAWFLAEQFAREALVPGLPADAEQTFLASARAWHEKELEPRRVARAKSLVRWASSIFSLLSGNFRDSLDLMLQTLKDLRSRPEDPFGAERLDDMAPYFLFCLFAEAGRLEEQTAGGKAEWDQRVRELKEKLKQEYAANGIEDWVEDVLAGR